MSRRPQREPARRPSTAPPGRTAPGATQPAGPLRARLLLRASRRHLARHPWQLALSVLGVALGVAVVVGIEVANGSATRAFEISSEAVTGRATHQVLGGPTGLPEEVYRALVVDAGAYPAAPVVEGWVLARRQPPGESGRAGGDPAVAGGLPGGGASPGPTHGVASTAVGERPARPLRLLGVDPLAERPFRAYLAPLAPGGGDRRAGADLADFLTVPGAALVSAETAERLGVSPGDELAVDAGGTLHRLRLLGVLSPADALAREALADLVAVDVATAQEVLGRIGRLSRIDLILPAGEAGDAAAEKLRRALPPGTELVATEARSRTTRGMTRAFRLNLRALSLLALMCGLFLIYNTISFSVVQRRTLLGTLRAVGVTRRQVLALVLAEALAVGLLGTALGLALGVGMARGLVELVSRTINDLYFNLEVQRMAVSAAALGTGVGVGLGATLVAALAPALEAASAPPRSALLRSEVEAGARRVLPRASAAGAALLVAGAGLMALPGTALATSFGGLFGVLMGCALLVPAATLGLMRLVRPALGRAFGLLGRMAAGAVAATLSRTAVAVAALTLAVSVTVGVGTMVASFRQAVDRWLDASLGADLYLTAPALGDAFTSAPFDPSLLDRLAAVPGVARVESVRRAEIETATGRTRVVALDAAPGSGDRFDFLAGDPAAAWTAFRRGEAALVTESYAFRHRLGVGSRLRLRTDRGDRELPVAGVITSYASDTGLVYLSRTAWDRWFDDRTLSGVSVTAAPGTDLDRLTERLRRAAAEPRLVIQSGRALKEASLAVFDRTFLITGVLRLLAGAVAFIGVVSALMALQLERAREVGMLRAQGMTPGQVWTLITSQTGLMGLAAGMLSMPMGLVLAAVMIHVVNRRSFGWTMALEVSPAILGQAVALALVAALVAGLYPAWRMAATPPALALREE